MTKKTFTMIFKSNIRINNLSGTTGVYRQKEVRLRSRFITCKLHQIRRASIQDSSQQQQMWTDRAKEPKERKAPRRKRSFDLKDTGSWYFDFQKPEFEEESVVELDIDSICADKTGSQASLSLLGETSMEVQRRLFCEKAKQRHEKGGGTSVGSRDEDSVPSRNNYEYVPPDKEDIQNALPSINLIMTTVRVRNHQSRRIVDCSGTGVFRVLKCNFLPKVTAMMAVWFRILGMTIPTVMLATTTVTIMVS